jgi:uncharacterized protein (DUF1501 family)
MSQTRREFLGSASLVSLGLSVPTFLHRSALAAGDSKKNADRVLVVIQLSGGNDGLNTVIPYKDELYAKNRQVLRIPTEAALKINDQIALHPALKGMHELLEAGRLAVLQGVGYPNASRSHFRSMDIWQTASNAERLPSEGWLGRAIGRTELRRPGTLPAMHFGGQKLPLALVGRTEVPSLSSLEEFRLQVAAATRPAIRQVATGDRSEATLQFVQQSTLQAYTAADRLEELTRKYDTPVKYPGSELARKLKIVAQLIDSGFGTRIFYTALEGFDTHAAQAQQHANLLTELSGAVKAFVDDLAHHGHLDRVVVMTFSEFGRRVKENASRGTDHGAAAPLFLAGTQIQAGPTGAHPSLSDLDDGDLKHHTDFRALYAALLEHWLGCPSEPVLGGRFAPLALVKSKA